MRFLRRLAFKRRLRLASANRRRAQNRVRRLRSQHSLPIQLSTPQKLFDLRERRRRFRPIHRIPPFCSARSRDGGRPRVCLARKPRRCSHRPLPANARSVLLQHRDPSDRILRRRRGPTDHRTVRFGVLLSLGRIPLPRLTSQKPTDQRPGKLTRALQRRSNASKKPKRRTTRGIRSRRRRRRLSPAIRTLASVLRSHDDAAAVSKRVLPSTSSSSLRVPSNASVVRPSFYARALPRGIRSTASVRRRRLTSRRHGWSAFESSFEESLTF